MVSVRKGCGPAERDSDVLCSVGNPARRAVQTWHDLPSWRLSQFLTALLLEYDMFVVSDQVCIL